MASTRRPPTGAHAGGTPPSADLSIEGTIGEILKEAQGVSSSHPRNDPWIVDRAPGSNVRTNPEASTSSGSNSRNGTPPGSRDSENSGKSGSVNKSFGSSQTNQISSLQWGGDQVIVNTDNFDPFSPWAGPGSLFQPVVATPLSSGVGLSAVSAIAPAAMATSVQDITATALQTRAAQAANGASQPQSLAASSTTTKGAANRSAKFSAINDPSTDELGKATIDAVRSLLTSPKNVKRSRYDASVPAQIVQDLIKNKFASLYADVVDERYDGQWECFCGDLQPELFVFVHDKDDLGKFPCLREVCHLDALRLALVPAEETRPADNTLINNLKSMLVPFCHNVSQRPNIEAVRTELKYPWMSIFSDVVLQKLIDQAFEREEEQRRRIRVPGMSIPKLIASFEELSGATMAEVRRHLLHPMCNRPDASVNIDLVEARVRSSHPAAYSAIVENCFQGQWRSFCRDLMPHIRIFSYNKGNLGKWPALQLVTATHEYRLAFVAEDCAKAADDSVAKQFTVFVKAMREYCASVGEVTSFKALFDEVRERFPYSQLLSNSLLRQLLVDAMPDRNGGGGGGGCSGSEDDAVDGAVRRKRNSRRRRRRATRQIDVNVSAPAPAERGNGTPIVANGEAPSSMSESDTSEDF